MVFQGFGNHGLELFLFFYRRIKDGLFNMSVDLQFRINLIKEFFLLTSVGALPYLLKESFHLLMILFKKFQSAHCVSPFNSVVYFFINGGSPAPPYCPMRCFESCSKG